VGYWQTVADVTIPVSAVSVGDAACVDQCPPPYGSGSGALQLTDLIADLANITLSGATVTRRRTVTNATGCCGLPAPDLCDPVAGTTGTYTPASLGGGSQTGTWELVDGALTLEVPGLGQTVVVTDSGGSFLASHYGPRGQFLYSSPEVSIVCCPSPATVKFADGSTVTFPTSC
jgi:hypothetical protein